MSASYKLNPMSSSYNHNQEDDDGQEQRGSKFFIQSTIGVCCTEIFLVIGRLKYHGQKRDELLDEFENLCLCYVQNPIHYHRSQVCFFTRALSLGPFFFSCSEQCIKRQERSQKNLQCIRRSGQSPIFNFQGNLLMEIRR